MRTFIAIAMPVDVGKTIEQFQKEASRILTGIRWLSPKNLHITLKFLGEIEESKLPEIKEAVIGAANGISPFNINLAGTGVFPNKHAPRIFWVGLKTGGDVLSRLAKNIEESVENLGFPRGNRQFQSHVTIGRFRGWQEITGASAFEDRDFGQFDAENIYIMKSTLAPHGAVYSMVESIKLCG